jgi:hypothetical protein
MFAPIFVGLNENYIAHICASCMTETVRGCEQQWLRKNFSQSSLIKVQQKKSIILFFATPKKKD